MIPRTMPSAALPAGWSSSSARREENSKAWSKYASFVQTIAGTSLKKKEAEAKRLGRDHNASIIVWGELTAFLGQTEFQPRVTLVRPNWLPTATAVLAPMTNALERQKVSPPPGTIIVPPQPVKRAHSTGTLPGRGDPNGAGEVV